MMAEVVTLMFTELLGPISPILSGTEARGGDARGVYGGYGILCARVGTALVTQVFANGMRLGQTVTKLDGSFAGRLRPEEPWRRTVPLTRAAPELDLAEQVEWHAVDAGLWNIQITYKCRCKSHRPAKRKQQ